MGKIQRYVIGLVMFLAIVLFALWLAKPVQADENGLMLVDSTAYYDKYGYGHGADGRALVEGLTLAGKKEWIGMSAALYDTDMNYLGTYEFRDTGYGQSTGKGSSKILKGRSVGTIENGTCIDVYFNTYSGCKSWGRRKVYMKLIKAVG